MTRFQMIRRSLCAFAVAAVVGLGSSEAQAQVFIGGGHAGGFHGGHHGTVHHGGHGGHRGWLGGGVHGGGWHRPAHTWHDTSHWDYQPARLQWHGNHFDYVPGQYRWHRQGHVDHNHH